MLTLILQLRQDLGLSWDSGIYRNRRFILAIIAGFVVVGLLNVLLPADTVAVVSSGLAMTVNWVIWSPLLEELLFRGVVQGQLQRLFKAGDAFLGLSYANWVTSFIFAGIHFVHHPPLWAAAVLFPSLVFGYFRDRENSVLPAIILHGIYNAQMLFLLG